MGVQRGSRSERLSAGHWDSARFRRVAHASEFPGRRRMPVRGCPLPTSRRSFGASRLSLHGLPAGQWFSIFYDDVRSATGARGRAGEARDSLVRNRRGFSDMRRTLRGLLRAPLESEHSVPGNRRDSPGHFRRYELARTDRPSMDDSRSTVRSDPERRASIGTQATISISFGRRRERHPFHDSGRVQVERCGFGTGSVQGVRRDEPVAPSPNGSNARSSRGARATREGRSKARRHMECRSSRS